MAKFIQIEISYPIAKNKLINTDFISEITKKVDGTSSIHMKDGDIYEVVNKYDELADVLAVNANLIKSLNS